MLFNSLARQHPEITLKISKMVAEKSAKCQQPASDFDIGRNTSNLRTVAILPASAHVPLGDFSTKLHKALLENGDHAKLLNYASATEFLGRQAFSRIGHLKLSRYLADLEECNRLVLMVADGVSSSPWTQRCIRQADFVFVVAIANESPGLGDHERVLLNLKTTARKELVLLHPDRQVQSGSTIEWLSLRPWIQAHHHVQMALVNRPPLLREHGRKNTLVKITKQLINIYDEYRPGRPPVKRQPSASTYSGKRGDFARLARRLCDRSVGLVLGGGGAKGFAHIGVIKALEEAGVPVDMVGGTSMGAFIGGLYARDSDHVTNIPYAKLLCSRLNSWWRMALDLTYPYASWFQGHEFNRSIWKCFGDARLEDLWLPYYCNTTNITWSRMDCHREVRLFFYVFFTRSNHF